MDICLNITSGKPVNKSEKNKLTKKKDENEKNRFKKVQCNDNLKSLKVGAKKRIKQKFLANIVANNLKQGNVQKDDFKEPILQNKNVKDNSKSILSKLSKPFKFQSKSKEKIVSNEKSDSNQELDPILKFAKPNFENNIKTILAKKRNDSAEPKKSLSNIFSKDSKKENDSELLLSNNDDDEPIINVNNFKNKEKNHKLKNNDNVKKENKTNFKELNSKPGGKISSLFGHNPEIPNIGQRFVKPIQEKVFTVSKFSEIDIHPFSVSNLEQNMQISTMTTVQKKSIPVILSGKDVLIRSQTGSGKTLAYALPIVESLQKIRPKLTRTSGINALIVVPTRELALQTYECFLKLIKPFTWIVPGYLIGGEKRKAEKARLRKGCNILVATPGRLLDHLKHTKALRLNSVKIFVLDEADRMFDMGYEKDVSEIVSSLKLGLTKSSNSGYDPLQMLRKSFNKESCNGNEEEKTNLLSDEEMDQKENEVDEKESHEESDNNSEVEENKNQMKESAPERQTILLSATLTHNVEKLAGLTMHNPVFVDAAKENIEEYGGNIGDANEDLVVPQSVTQSYIVTPPKLRLVTLSAYIAGKCQNHGDQKILIFMATQDMVDYYTEILSSILNKPSDEEDEDSDPLVDVEFFKLHGNMLQKERTEIFKSFRATKTGVLLSTDVAARGLDLPKVNCIVQYTGPTSARDYVHRIGRTARAGTSGVSVIFLTPPEVEFIRELESRKIRIKQDDENDVLSNLLGPLSRHNSAREAAINLQNDFENFVLENKKLHSMACKAYVSWVRFYSSYPREMREYFNRKEIHLGHYAKSFALRDPPQRIGAAGKLVREKDNEQPKHNNRLTNERNNMEFKKRKDIPKDRKTSLKNVRMLNTSEYGSGLEPVKKFKKV